MTRTVLLAALFALVSLAAQAQTHPNRALRMIVPFAPGGTLGARLQRELPAVSQNPEYRKRIVDIGQEVTEPLQGEAFGQVIRAEAARWRELATMAGVKDE